MRFKEIYTVAIVLLEKTWGYKRLAYKKAFFRHNGPDYFDFSRGMFITWCPVIPGQTIAYYDGNMRFTPKIQINNSVEWERYRKYEV